MLRHAANAFVRVALAPTCVACGTVLARPLAGPVCETCWAAVRRFRPPLCPQCGEPVASRMSTYNGPCRTCGSSRAPWNTARSVGPYEEPLRAILHAFKYDHRRVLAPMLAELLRQAGGDILEGVAAVVPVPLHPWRAMRRGFNQSDDLARALGPPVWRALRRTRLRTPQAGLTGRARITNVDGAFLAGRRRLWPSRRWTRRLAGARVVLVDDVMTTGATMTACTRALLDAGVSDVRVLTVARTPIRSPR